MSSLQKLLIVLGCLALVPFAAFGLFSMGTCGLIATGKVAHEVASANAAAAPPLRVPPEAAPQVAAVAAKPDPVVVSFVTFAKNSALSECDDVSIQPEQALPIEQRQKAPETIAKSMTAMMKKTGATLLHKTCTEQFSDRTVLATCTHTNEITTDAGSAEIIATGRFYLTSILDAQMQMCIKETGDWQALPHDSPAFQAAHLEEDRRRLEKFTDSVPQ